MSYGKPVIAYDNGGPAESILNGETGYLVQNTREITEKMTKLTNSKDKVEEIGLNTKEHSKKYSWEKFVEKFDKTVKNK